MRKVLHLLGTLGEQDLEWLVSHGQVRFVPRNTTIIQQGKAIDTLFILLEGQLSVRIAGLNDREVAGLYPGEVLGEISFVDARPPSASVISVQDSHLLAVSKDVLERKLGRDDAFAARFYRGVAIFLADRLRTTTAHLGYGKWEPADQPELEPIDDGALDEISLARRRFDELLRRLRLTEGSSGS
jgi:CRP/FNR family cyclic AMP-dependent transcriptional regulator